MQKDIVFSQEEKRSFVEEGMDETRIRKLAERISQCFDQNGDLILYLDTRKTQYEVFDIVLIQGEVSSSLTTVNFSIKEEELDFIRNKFLQDYYHDSVQQYADVMMLELKKRT